MGTASNTASEGQRSEGWQHMKDFWETLSDEQRSEIQSALDAGVVSPEVTNASGQHAYIDGIQTAENGELTIIGQIV